MTGLRKEIAKHVVLNILETLGEDDFVTIYKFSKVRGPLLTSPLGANFDP
jgi:voltage-dependent calcium channel alpha-2/delta-3